MGLSASFLNGISQATLYVALVLYGKGIGMSEGTIGGLIICLTLGGMLLQVPLGKWSDKIDRRLLIAIVPACSIPVCLVIVTMENSPTHILLLYLFIALLGGLTLPIYSICMAHMNDHLRASQTVAASGTLILILAAGMALGATLSGIAVEQWGPNGMFYLLITVAMLKTLTALFRFWRSPGVPVNKGKALPITNNLSPEAASLYQRDTHAE